MILTITHGEFEPVLKRCTVYYNQDYRMICFLGVDGLNKINVLMLEFISMLSCIIHKILHMLESIELKTEIGENGFNDLMIQQNG